MRGLRFCCSSSSALGLTLLGFLLAGISLVFAENTSPNAPQTVTASVPQISGSASIETLSPEKMGDLMMARQSYVAALDSYQHATLTSAIVWNKIGMAYHHLFAMDQAKRAYQTSLAVDPHYPAALNNLAAIYHGQKNYNQAEHLYKRALKYSPNAAITYCNLGTTYFAEAKYKQGMKAYKRAFTLDPRVFDPDQPALVEEGSTREQLVAINYYLAKTYASAGKKEQAINYLRKAINEGFHDRKRLMEDKELAPIRETPEFHQLLAEEHMN